MKKRALALALTLLLALSLFPAALAAPLTLDQLDITWLPSGLTPSGGDRNIGEFWREGLGVVRDENNNKYGYIDTAGKLIVPCIYDTAWDFHEGLAVVGIGEKHGYIDRTGQVIVPLAYDSASNFREGLAVVGIGEKHGYIDRTGQVIVPLAYDSASNFREGLAAVGTGGKYGYIDRTGQMVIPFVYDYAGDFSEGLAVVKVDGEYGYIDQTGAFVIPAVYKTAIPFSEGYAVAGEEEAYYDLLDTQGNAKRIPGCRWVSGGYWSVDGGFSDGMLAVANGYPRDGGTWGFIDTSGELVIPYQYRYVDEPFSDGTAKVTGPEGEIYIDKNGDRAFPAQKLWMETLARTYSSGFRRLWFSQGLAPVYLGDADNGFGYIDETGKIVIESCLAGFPAYYLAVECEYHTFQDGVAMVLHREGRYGEAETWGILKHPFLTGLAYPSTQTVELDGAPVEFQMYALKDYNGNPTNYVKVRDVAQLLDGTDARFNIGFYAGGVHLVSGQSYTPNGTELSTPFSGERSYDTVYDLTDVNGKMESLDAIRLTDDAGGGYTYYKLRDLGKALGFNVGWSAQRGVYIETDKPYQGG